MLYLIVHGLIHSDKHKQYPSLSWLFSFVLFNDNYLYILYVEKYEEKDI